MLNAFFFQAEDGIRDIGVTGVQTCALPISLAFAKGDFEKAKAAYGRALILDPKQYEAALFTGDGRSEERRVGKECRYGGTAADLKLKSVLASRGAIQQQLPAPCRQ